MQAQKQKLFDQIAAHGWTLTEIGKWELDWWADEMWILESVWSPTNCRVYLTFLTNPEISHPITLNKNEGIYAVQISPLKPEDRLAVPNSFTLYLNGWQRDLPNFLKHLSALRQNCVN